MGNTLAAFGAAPLRDAFIVWARPRARGAQAGSPLRVVGRRDDLVAQESDSSEMTSSVSAGGDDADVLRWREANEMASSAPGVPNYQSIQAIDQGNWMRSKKARGRAGG